MTSALNSTVHQRGAASPAPRRKRLSTTERLALLERENATCHLCKGIIQPGQAWDVSHEIPLELGGADDDENRRAAHRKCHRVHTAAVDLPTIAKAKRNYAKHRGAAVSRQPMRGGRRDALKKRMDGTVVLRATGKPWKPASSPSSSVAYHAEASPAFPPHQAPPPRPERKPEGDGDEGASERGQS